MLAQVSERLDAAQENAAQQATHAAGRLAELEQCVVALPGLECEAAGYAVREHKQPHPVCLSLVVSAMLPG